MLLIPSKLGLAAATAAILWLTCSLSVSLMPRAMMLMSGHMVHSELSDFAWTLSASGVSVGLIAWSAVAGISAWLLGLIYNRLISQQLASNA